MSDWLDSAIQLQHDGMVDSALDVIYEKIDDWGVNEEFAPINAIMEDSRMQTLDLDLLLGVITAPHRWRRHLPSRAALINLARRRFTAAGEDAEAILRGLDIP